MSQLRSVLLVLLFLLLLPAACAREEGEATPPTEPTAASTVAAAAAPTVRATSEPSPLPTETALPTPEPTQIVPAVEVADQPLLDDGRLTIAQVVVPEAAWLVLHAVRDGQVEEVLAFAAVDAGANQDVVVVVDPLQVSNTLAAMVHVDGGQAGSFEFPGTDAPLRLGDEPVMGMFEVERQFETPSISVTDQEIEEDGLARIDSVYAMTAGWLAIHADVNGAIGPILGFAFVEQGLSEGIVIPVQWRLATPKLRAVLYADSGADRRWEPEVDLPVILNGELVHISFEVTLPPDILVLDQPVVDGRIVVERVISRGPSWLVVYFDQDGDMGRIIGFAPLVDGVNEQVTIDVVEAAVTTELHILNHEDTVSGDEFDFPAADQPISYKGRFPTPITFRTNPGNYLITRDQPLQVDAESGATSVTIPLIVLDSPSWLVIRADSDGSVGDIIASVKVPAGISRDLTVTLDATQTTAALYAALHLDAGEIGELEFPDGPDIPLRQGREEILSPFLIFPDETG